jgi:hypothetical protein
LRKDEALSISYSFIIGEETWRSVESVPGLLASSKGRVMSVPYRADLPNGGERWYRGKPWFGAWAKSSGKNRFTIMLRRKTYRVARLICEAFNGPHPFDKPVAMHLDENSRNNLPGNLAWGTQKQNLNAPGFIEYCKSRTGENSPTVKGRKKR